MSRFEDLTNKTFGKLTVLKFVGKNKWQNALWLCKCECGKTKILSNGELKRGVTKSCGCSKGTLISKAKTNHGMTYTRFYKIWESMKRRCYSKSGISFKRYGARNIKVCDRWLKFENFYNDMYEDYLEHVKEFGEKDTTIDRKNVDGNYEPSNCRWATYKEQNNNRSTNTIIVVNGESLTISQASKKFNIPDRTLSYRIRNGWSVDKAINQPVKKYNGGLKNGKIITK